MNVFELLSFDIVEFITSTEGILIIVGILLLIIGIVLLCMGKGKDKDLSVDAAPVAQEPVPNIDTNVAVNGDMNGFINTNPQPVTPEVNPQPVVNDVPPVGPINFSESAAPAVETPSILNAIPTPEPVQETPSILNTPVIDTTPIVEPAIEPTPVIPAPIPEVSQPVVQPLLDEVKPVEVSVSAPAIENEVSTPVIPTVEPVAPVVTPLPVTPEVATVTPVVPEVKEEVKPTPVVYGGANPELINKEDLIENQEKYMVVLIHLRILLQFQLQQFVKLMQVLL